MRSALSFAMGTALALMAPAALAQDNQAGVSGSVGGSAQLPPPPAVAAPAPAAAPPTAVAQSSTARVEPADDGISDHEKYAVGHFAIGYLGFTTIPLDGMPAGVSAPVIGVRYWLNEKIGLDLGAGLGLTGGSTETTNGNVTTTTDKAGVFGLALHGGVPIALAHQKHYKFLVIPELNVAFAHMSQAVPNQNDISHNGFHLDVGARAGAEIHFGFIGIPQLALQATIGAFLRTDHTSFSQDTPTGTNKGSDSTTSLGTSVQSDPWALFVNNISALYYFP